MKLAGYFAIKSLRVIGEHSSDKKLPAIYSNSIGKPSVGVLKFNPIPKIIASIVPFSKLVIASVKIPAIL